MKSHGGGKRTLAEEKAGIDSLLPFLDVDVKSGRCFWNQTRNNLVKQGDEAGKDCGDYSRISFNKKAYKRHRIIFYVANGYLPLVVDHKHGVEAGDGIDNLQEATIQQNTAKQKKRKDNSSGFRGVSCRNGRWIAQIQVNGKKQHIGSFDSMEEAQNAYNQKSKEVFGEFTGI